MSTRRSVLRTDSLALTMGNEQRRTMKADERYRSILSVLRDEGRIDAKELASRFAVTGETLRKDLIQLEALGRLRRVHGGALPPESIMYESDVSLRLEFPREKARIAEAALAEVPASGSILVDSGSTTARLAERMPGDRDLVVFTNAMAIATELAERRRLAVHVIGGRLRAETNANVGSAAERALDEINVDVAFLGTNGISARRGLTTPDPAEAAVKRAMLSTTRRRVLLCDHSKFDAVSGVQHARLDDIDLIITDREPSASMQQVLERANVEIRVAGA